MTNQKQAKGNFNAKSSIKSFSTKKSFWNEEFNAKDLIKLKNLLIELVS